MTRSVSRRPAGEPPLGAVLGRGDLQTSLLLVFPLFLVYGVGVLFAPVMNGVDFFSRNLLALVDGDTDRYLLVHAALAVVYVGYLAWYRRRHRFHLGRALPMLAESTIYALVLASVIFFIMREILGIAPELATGAPAPSGGPPALSGNALPGGFAGAILSIGAGVHEELVFRLGGLAGGAAILRLLGVRHVAAVALAFVVSSALFSAAHHVGPLGEPWILDVFVYRLLAGLLFGLLFYFRSLAHATYTHALYDLWVLVLV